MKAAVQAKPRDRCRRVSTKRPGLVAIFSFRLFAVLLAGLCLLPRETTAASAQDSGWIALYDGTLDNFKIYIRGRGYVANDDQDTYFADSGFIRVSGSGSNGLCSTNEPLSFYHARVWYRWGKGAGNAGLMTHVDLESTVKKDNRPRSVELNMRSDEPGSIWLASGLGPFGSTYVKPGSKDYLPKDKGGEWHDADPWGDRTIYAYYPDGGHPTKSAGEWNLYEAWVWGADSLAVLINGVELNRLYDIRLPRDGEKVRGEPNVWGGLALQAEGAEIHYRDFAMRHLDSTTGLPVVPVRYVSPAEAAQRINRLGSWQLQLLDTGRLPGGKMLLLPEGRASARDVLGRRWNMAEFPLGR